jgi:hypothetical protein
MHWVDMGESNLGGFANRKQGSKDFEYNNMKREQEGQLATTPARP